MEAGESRKRWDRNHMGGSEGRKDPEWTLDQAKPTEGRMGPEAHAGCHLHGATMLREQVKHISVAVGKGVLGGQKHLSQ